MSFKSHGLCVMGLGIVLENDYVLGGGDWKLATDLLINFGQKLFLVNMTL